MKKFLTILICLSLIIGTLSAQTPNAFKYQAVVRNNAGQIIVNQNVGFRISILQTSATGTVVYSEKHTAQTNAFGLVNLEIGKGTIQSGTFSAIDWGTGSYFVKIELDANNSGLFSEMGTSQLLAVPYALNAQTAQNYIETDPLFVSSPANTVSSTNITNWNTTFGWGNHAGLYRPITYVPAWSEVTNKPVFSTVATSGSYNDLLNKPAPYVSGAGILFTGSTISANLSLHVSETGDILTLTPGNSVYVPGISNANFPTPIVTTKQVTNISSTKAYGSGNVLFYGSTAVTETGLCWGLNQPPTYADNHIASGIYEGDFICAMNGLTANTMYFVRAYAKTAAAIYYGETVLFTTSNILPVPTLTTTEVSGITENAALSGGYISVDGGSPVTARGVCWGTSPSPTTANSKTTNATGNGLFTSYMTGLTLNTLYYIRAYATNANGTNYGPELFFKTAGIIPTVTSATPSAITANTVILGGSVTAIGSAAVTERGICFSTSINPTISNVKVVVGSGIGSFSTSDARIKPNTTYHVRAYATNSVGTGYGQDQIFTTSDAYYESFETDFPGGLTGAWGIRTGDVAEGYFSLQTSQNGAEASLTRTLLNSGQILYWTKNNACAWESSSITFYIDDNELVTTSDANWLQKSFPVSAGKHTFKWKFNTTCGNGWIDNIIMPK